MKRTISFFIAGAILCMAAVWVQSGHPGIVLNEQQVALASAPWPGISIVSLDERKKESSSDERHLADGEVTLLDPDGSTLESRFLVPAGYNRLEKPAGSLQGYLRQFSMKPDKSPVLLYNGKEKNRQDVHAAVFAMPLVAGDLQQCADSVIRMYGEYLWSVKAYDAIAFHLTNGFLMDYPSWRAGKRLVVDNNHVSWVKKADYDESRESFLKYLRQVMVYAGTLSLEKECTSVDLSQVLAGDLLIRGGSPGHCVMVVDVAEDEFGNRCFLLAQGYMPAQEFHVLNNPLHDDDPWYYSTEIKDTVATPEYSFSVDSLKRWKEFSR
ncbi:DUF4846 domain-containing protein [Lacrimispora sp.]|uniref:DUF4846 domain-containing protein n=1 Tax=Lacrimispora sp. TaxID=2719234 RepID=UPI0029E7AA4E|nr:hypothetical protein [Lacrimispora sp.]